MKEVKHQSKLVASQNPLLSQTKSITIKNVIVNNNEHHHNHHEHEEEEEYDLHEAIHLWRVATGLFPYIVSKFGFFSSEMLMGMLGIHIDDNYNRNNDNTNEHNNKSNKLQHDDELDNNEKGNKFEEISPLTVDNYVKDSDEENTKEHNNKSCNVQHDNGLIDNSLQEESQCDETAPLILDRLESFDDNENNELQHDDELNNNEKENKFEDTYALKADKYLKSVEMSPKLEKTVAQSVEHKQGHVTSVEHSVDGKINGKE